MSDKKVATVEPFTGAIYVYLRSDDATLHKVGWTQHVRDDPLVNIDYCECCAEPYGVEVLP